MKLYKANFYLQGVLIFSSEVRPMISASSAMGSYISPSPHIHNYPIMYGMLGKPAEAYFVFPSLHYLSFTERKGRTTKTNKGLQYTSIKKLLDDFKKGKDSFYVFPLLPVKFTVSSFLLSAESWSYVLPTRSSTKNVFPRITSYSAFMPGSIFTTYVLTQGNVKLPQWIRIGKKRWGIFKVEYEEVKVKKVEKRSNELTTIPINYSDAEYFGFKIKSFSKVLETPNVEEGMIGWAELEECQVINNQICLPINWQSEEKK
ncbi:type I-D CRISPR-associated protein Cas5/Csc1 [Sulfolobus islandicus]|nr:type I-D CRISPR-associated protein Cas5/Csc1 [Sulfolobus islandicus]WCM36550.1 type I-D CRISPR-associated protein Cas5/Csc1 [Sulfolobus islandicus]